MIFIYHINNFGISSFDLLIYKKKIVCLCHIQIKKIHGKCTNTSFRDTIV